MAVGQDVSDIAGGGGDLLEDAIVRVLRRAPERWSELDIDGLTAVEEDALRLVTAAAMVERRFSIRLSLIGHPVRIEVTATITGEHGLVQAMGPVLQKAWDAWKEFYLARRDAPEEDSPKVFCEKTGPEMWRLTQDGVLALQDLDGDRSRSVLDFVQRLSPVFHGAVVPGSGRAERLDAKQEPETPAKDEVTNLSELTGVMKEISEALQAGFDKLATASQKSKASVVPVKIDPSKRGKRGPDRMSIERAWHYLTIAQEWAGIQERNRELPMRDRYQKVQLAEKHGITKKELDAILGWYAKHRRENRFPDDPQTLSKGELRKWFE